MRPFLCAALLLVPAAARAQDNKANSLTPQQIQEGWLLLFDGKTPFGWDSEGELNADKGTLIVGGKKTSVARLTTRFSSFELRLECRCEGDEAGKLVLKRGPAVRSHNLERSGNNPGWDVLTLTVEFDPAVGSESETLDYVTVGGNKISGQASSQGSSGPAALRFEAPAGTKVILRNVRLKPLATKSLFNGKDLTGWKVDKAQEKVWKVEDGTIHYAGKGGRDLTTAKNYKDFELWLDWKITKGGDSGIFLRGQPQVQIWDNKEGSGGLYNNPKGKAGRVPLVVADRPVGEWNTFYIKMVGSKVTVKLNDKLVVDNAEFIPLGKSPPATGPIMLQIHGSPLWFRNIFIKEL